MTIPFKPYYQDDAVTIYNADCRKVLPWLEPFDLLLTDPPYGIGVAKKGKTGGNNRAAAKDYGDQTWDVNQPRWLIETAVSSADKAIVWGGNYFDLPPMPGWLVWDKNRHGTTFAECELAWTNAVSSVRRIKWLWDGYWQENMKDKDVRVHPTQKPLAVMRWCLSLVEDAATVLDPFMGSGTTLVAAKLEGRQAVGIEINEEYCEAAAKRLEQGVLFGPDLQEAFK